MEDNTQTTEGTLFQCAQIVYNSSSSTNSSSPEVIENLNISNSEMNWISSKTRKRYRLGNLTEATCMFQSDSESSNEEFPFSVKVCSRGNSTPTKVLCVLSVKTEGECLRLFKAIDHECGKMKKKKKSNGRSIHLKLDDLLEEKGLNRDLLVRRLSTPTNRKDNHDADGFEQKERRCFYNTLRQSFEEEKEEEQEQQQPKKPKPIPLGFKTPMIKPSSTKKTAIVKSAVVHKTMSHFLQPLVIKLAHLTVRADVNGPVNETHVFRLLGEAADMINECETKILQILAKTKDTIDTVEISIQTKRGEMEYLRNILRETRDKFDEYLGDSLQEQQDEDRSTTAVLFRKAVNETQEQLAVAITCMNDDTKSLLECQKSVFSASKKVHWFGAMLKRRAVLVSNVVSKENKTVQPLVSSSSQFDQDDNDMEKLTTTPKVEMIELKCLSPRLESRTTTPTNDILGMTELKSFRSATKNFQSISPIGSEDETVIVSKTPPPPPPSSPADPLRRTDFAVVDELNLGEPAVDLMTLATMSPHHDFVGQVEELKQENKNNFMVERADVLTTKQAHERKKSFNLNFTRGTSLDTPTASSRISTRKPRTRKTKTTKRKKKIKRQHHVESAYYKQAPMFRENPDVDVYDILRGAISKIRRGIFDQTIRKIMSECKVADLKSHGLLASLSFSRILRKNIPTLRGKRVQDVVKAADTQQDGLIDYNVFFNRVLRRRGAYTHQSIRKRVLLKSEDQKKKIRQEEEIALSTTTDFYSSSFKHDDLIERTLQRLESKILETPRLSNALAKLEVSSRKMDDEEPVGVVSTTSTSQNDSSRCSTGSNKTRRKSFRSERRAVEYEWGRGHHNGGFQSPPDN